MPKPPALRRLGRTLICFQSSGFACDENDRAIHHIQCAMDALLRRQTNRAARGVLGKNQE